MFVGILILIVGGLFVSIILQLFVNWSGVSVKNRFGKTIMKPIRKPDELIDLSKPIIYSIDDSTLEKIDQYIKNLPVTEENLHLIPSHKNFFTVYGKDVRVEAHKILNNEKSLIKFHNTLTNCQSIEELNGHLEAIKYLRLIDNYGFTVLLNFYSRNTNN